MSERDPYYKIEAVSNSFLTTYSRMMKGIKPKGDTSAFKIGRGVHELIMEPHKFQSEIYTGKERVLMMNMAESVHDNLEFDWSGEVEKDYFFVRHGMKCKSKVDITQPAAIIDFKTTRFVKANHFRSAIKTYKYYRQASFYLDIPQVKAAGINKFIIIAISKTKPHPLFLFEFDRDGKSVLQGKMEIERFLLKMQNDPRVAHLKVDAAWLDRCKANS